MTEYKYLSPEFLKQYEGVDPFPTAIGKLTYKRTYSRYIETEGRREEWIETVARSVDYNIGLGNGTVDEAEKLFDNIFNLRQFLSGRTLWIGGTDISKEYPMANYNCAFAIVEDVDIFHELFYLLLIGAGVGIRATHADVEKLPAFRQDIKFVNVDYFSLSKEFECKQEYTDFITFEVNDGEIEAEIYVGDSKEGWVQAIKTFIMFHSDPSYKNVTQVSMNYNAVRPKGERLKRFGGYASGHEAIADMFTKLSKILSNNKTGGKLNPTEVIDICNIIGEAVVSGGVRRTAEIALIDPNDTTSIGMKSSLYAQDDEGNWVVNEELLHRQMSNNSIVYYEKPTREQLHWQIDQMRYSGEPAFVNAQSASKRREHFEGVNPCAEILLDSRGMCNLTELNVMAFVKDGYFSRTLDIISLLEAQRMSIRAGMRMTLPELELHRWNTVHKRDRLIGASLTGWYDMVNATNMNREDQIRLLKALKTNADMTAKAYARELGINEPLLKTTIKPSGTLSLLPTVSSGIHRSHSEYYIRRIRINSTDPLSQFLIDSGVPWNPEVGQTADDMKTTVFDFPVKAPIGTYKQDVSAIQQLEDYLMFMDYYADHNVSITVSVKDDEWEEVEQWMDDHWDDVVAVSFLPLSDAFYQLMPFEEIDKETFEKLLDKMPDIDYNGLNKYESGSDFEIEDSSCEAGVCPIR